VHAEPLELVDERHQLVRFAALGEQDGDVVFTDDAEVSVHAVCRMQECGRRASGRERRGNLAADESGLADARDDDAAF
jgi:hypothetical protein